MTPDHAAWQAYFNAEMPAVVNQLRLVLGSAFDQHYPASGRHIDNRIMTLDNQTWNLYQKWRMMTAEWRLLSEQRKK